MLTYPPAPKLRELYANSRFHRFYYALNKANSEVRLVGLYAEHARPIEFTGGAMEKRLRKARDLVVKLIAEIKTLHASRAKPAGIDDEWRAIFNHVLEHTIAPFFFARARIDRSILFLNRPEVLWEEWERAWQQGLIFREDEWITEPGLYRLHREVLCLEMQRSSWLLQSMGTVINDAAEALNETPGAMLSPHTRRRRMPW